MPLPMSASEIADDMTDRIRAGEYPAGSKLPTYGELAVLYGVGLTTLAKVMAILRDRGLVIGSPGRGVYVPD